MLKLRNIFISLERMDIITTAVGREYVVCRVISRHASDEACPENRYVIAEICSSRDRCETVFPHSFKWDDAKATFGDAEGNPLPGWSEGATVDRNAYRGGDRVHLEYVLVSDELPTTETVTENEMATLPSRLRAIASLSPTNRITWHSVISALGVHMSDAQLFAMSRTFDPPKLPQTLIIGLVVVSK